MTKPTTPLRQRMIEDMAIRNMSPLTQAAYVRAVANFASHHGVSPDKLTFEDVRSYQVLLISRGLKTATIIPMMCASRLLYGTTRGKKDFVQQTPCHATAFRKRILVAWSCAAALHLGLAHLCCDLVSSRFEGPACKFGSCSPLDPRGIAGMTAPKCLR